MLYRREGCVLTLFIHSLPLSTYSLFSGAVYFIIIIIFEDFSEVIILFYEQMLKKKGWQPPGLLNGGKIWHSLSALTVTLKKPDYISQEQYDFSLRTTIYTDLF